MKTLLRSILLNGFALYVLPVIIGGFSIRDGISTLFIGAVALTLLNLVLKPILNFLSMPLHVLTLGLFSIVINALILYLLTIFVSQISIHEFVFPGFVATWFRIPSMHINAFFAYILSSLVLSVIVGVLKWITTE